MVRIVVQYRGGLSYLMSHMPADRYMQKHTNKTHLTKGSQWPGINTLVGSAYISKTSSGAPGGCDACDRQQLSWVPWVRV